MNRLNYLEEWKSSTKGVYYCSKKEQERHIKEMEEAIKRDILQHEKKIKKSYELAKKVTIK